MPGDFPALDKQELFTRLAQGHAAGITVVTPNRRLAQALAREFDEGQAATDLPVWETADILFVDTFIERFYEDALYASGAESLPQLLSPAQDRAIWESVLSGAPLLSVAETAANCAKTWRLAHEWRIDGVPDKFPGNDDTRAFLSIPARHDLWRRVSADWLAGLVVRGICADPSAFITQIS